MGITKTVEEMCARFYFHNVKSYVTMMNLNCVECIAKQKSHAKATHLPHRVKISVQNIIFLHRCNRKQEI